MNDKKWRMKFEKIHVINKISEFISGWLWFNLWRGITVDHRVFYFYIFFCIFSLHMLFTASYSLSSSRDWIEFREPTLINFFSSNKWNCLSTNANQLKLIDLFSQRKKNITQMSARIFSFADSTHAQRSWKDEKCFESVKN